MRRVRYLLIVSACCAGMYNWSGSAGASAPPLSMVMGTPHSLSAPFIGINLDQRVINELMSSSAAVDAVAGFQPGTLRYPGGTVANFWSWQNGTIDQPACSFGGPPNPPVQETTGFTIEKLRDVVTRSHSIPVFDLNVLTSTLDDQLSMLHAAQAKGIPITYVELGNEFYLRGSCYSGKFPSVNEYAALVAQWAPVLHRAFPGVRIAAVGAVHSTDARSKYWNSTVVSVAGSFIDAITLHNYPQVPDATWASTLSGMLADWTTVHNVLAAIPSTLSVWFTEYNIGLQNRLDGVATKWVHGLAIATMALKQANTPAIELCDYWDLFGTPAHGQNTAGVFTQDSTPQLTFAGRALATLLTASRGATSDTPITFPRAPLLGGNRAVFGTLFSRAGINHMVILNLTGQAVVIDTGSATLASSTSLGLSTPAKLVTLAPFSLTMVY